MMFPGCLLPLRNDVSHGWIMFSFMEKRINVNVSLWKREAEKFIRLSMRQSQVKENEQEGEDGLFQRRKRFEGKNSLLIQTSNVKIALKI